MEEKVRTNVNCASPSCKWNREGQKCAYPLDKPLVVGEGGKCQGYEARDEG